MKEKFQSFGKAMLVPITLIAISGLFLGIGSVFTTELTLVSLGVNWDWYAASPLFTFFSVFKGLGEVIIGNLGVLFAVGCAFSLSRKEKGWAAFSALVCYLTMLKTVEILLGAAGLAADNTTVEALQKVGLTSIQASEQSALYTTSLGFFGYSSGVFAGIIVGCLVAWITGRFYKTKLPTALAFFCGQSNGPHCIAGRRWHPGRHYVLRLARHRWMLLGYCDVRERLRSGRYVCLSLGAREPCAVWLASVARDAHVLD